MHELSIALSIVESAVEEAARHDGTPVAVHVRLGVLSGLVREALESSWEVVRRATPLATTALQIEEVPVAVWCADCQAERPVESLQIFRCAHCGSSVCEVLSGGELEITALEFDP